MIAADEPALSKRGNTEPATVASEIVKKNLWAGRPLTSKCAALSVRL